MKNLGFLANRLGEHVVNFLAPPACAFCGSIIAEGKQGACGPCLADLPRYEPIQIATAGPLDWYGAVLQYSFPVDIAIKAFKFDRKLYYGPAFSTTLRLAEAALPRDIDAILPVPLHWWRKTRRGFNQATEIATPFARELRLPLISIAKRVVATPFQSGLDARDRASNLCGAFNVRSSDNYKHVLIIDDVITTGATANALGESLRAAGVGQVSVLALARAANEPPSAS